MSKRNRHDTELSSLTGMSLSGKRLRLLVADDHPAILDAVADFVRGEEDVELVARAADGENALRLIADFRPDIAILDIRMPKLGGIEVLRRLVRSETAPAVILYTGYPDRSVLLESLDAGARGFVLKESPLSDLIRAVRIVAGGGTYIDPVLAGVLAGPQATERLSALTKREREVLRLLADGMRYEQAASVLFISPLTVRSHVRNAMTKLESDTRTQAVANALRQSLIS